jgi:hypothetical protein
LHASTDVLRLNILILLFLRPQKSLRKRRLFFNNNSLTA